MDIKNQWVHAMLMGRSTNDFLKLYNTSHFLKNIYLFERYQTQVKTRNTRRLDNISILWCISVFRIRRAQKLQSRRGLPASVHVSYSPIFSSFVVQNLLFAQTLSCRIPISLICFAHAYLYIRHTPTHVWHAATRRCRVNFASRQSENLDGEGQVAQNWCAVVMATETLSFLWFWCFYAWLLLAPPTNPLPKIWSFELNL